MGNPNHIAPLTDAQIASIFCQADSEPDALEALKRDVRRTSEILTGEYPEAALELLTALARYEARTGT